MAAESKAFTLRRAAPEDAPGVLACLCAAFKPFREQYSPAGFADSTLTPSTVHQRMQQMSVYVALGAAGEVVGTVGCHVASDLIDEQDDAHGVAPAKRAAPAKKDGHIRGMAVLPGWQGRGVADALLAAVERELRRLGCARVTLDTTAPLARASASMSATATAPPAASPTSTACRSTGTPRCCEAERLFRHGSTRINTDQHGSTPIWAKSL